MKRLYDDCKICTKKEDCTLPRQGYKDGVRCQYNQRGNTNNDLIYNEKYEDFTCENFNEIRSHINKHHNIFLHGKYGLGKSHLLLWIANKYNLQGKNIYYSLVAEVGSKLRKEIQHQKATGECIISETIKMKNVDVLFLDDIGNERITEFFAEQLQIVIDHRYIYNKPTFMSSNYTIANLFKVWSKGIGEVKAGQLCSRIKTYGEKEIIGKTGGQKRD